MADVPIEFAVEKLLGSGLVSEADLIGCSEVEIADVEARAGVRLPRVYRRFLARMGRSAGAFLEGSDFTCAALDGIRKDADGLVARSSAESKLKATDFVFLGHQGYEFLFFDCEKGDDPPVQLLTEDQVPREVFARFSQWLAVCAADEIAAASERERSRTNGGGR